MQKQSLHIRYKTLFWLLLLYAYHSYAQYPYIYSFNSTNTNGIIGGTIIREIGQDADSCIIIATENGLVRFNGFEFIKYSKNQADPNRRMPFEKIFQILTVRNGCWLATPIIDSNNVALSFFDNQHKIRSIKIKRLDAHSKNIGIGSLLYFVKIDEDNVIGLEGIDFDKSVLITQQGNNLPVQMPFPPNFYTQFHKGSVNYGNIIIDTTSHDISIYLANKWTKIPYKNIDYVENDRNFQNTDKYLLLNLTGVKQQKGRSMAVLYDIQQKKEVARNTFSNGYIEQFLANDDIFLQRNDPLILDKNLKAKKVSYISKESLLKINRFFTDKSGNYWLLFKGNDEIGVITKGAIDAQSKYWKFDKGIKKIAIDKHKNVWFFGTDGQFYCYHSGKIDKIQLSLPFTFSPSGLFINNDEMWICQEINNRLIRLWLPSIQFNKVNNLEQLTPQQSDMTGNIDYQWILHKPLDDKHFILNVAVSDIKVLSPSKILTCSYKEPALLEIKKNSISIKHIGKGNLGALYSFCTDDKGRIWYGRASGLYLDKTKVKGFPNTSVSKIKMTSDHKLWVATQTQGAWICDTRTLEVRQAEHTKQTQIFDFYIENDGVWIASDNGLTFKQNDGKVLFYGYESGLPSLYVYSIASNDSLLYFGTSNGFTIFKKAIFKKNYLKPSSLTFEYARITDRSLLEKNSEKNFPYDENYLAIQLKDNSINQNLQDKKYEFHLLLNGVELLNATDYSNYSNDFKQVFPSLTPGNYVFYVIRKGLDGQSYGRSPVLSFVILPPFWKSWEVLSLFFLSIIGILIWYFRRQKDIEIKMNELEMEALSSQINPHFLGNSLTAIGALVLSEKDSFKAYSYIVHFSSMVRQFMLSSVKRFFLIENELTLLENYLIIESLRFKNFDYSIENKLPPSTSIPAGMIQPFVENALKHGILANNSGTRGMIKISFSKAANVITCRIEDNGKGIEASKKEVDKKATRTSVSLVNIQRRVDLLNNSKYYRKVSLQILDKSNISDETGTIVILSLTEK